MDGSLRTRATALAAEAQARRGELEERKATLLVEREDEVAKVREAYRERIETVEEEIKLADRLRRALDPEGTKRANATAAKPAEPDRRTPRWRPQPETILAVMAAMEDGAETVAQIMDSERVEVSRATVDSAVHFARDDGWVRLAGRSSAVGGPKTYRLTPQGIQHLRESMNGAHA
jgi:hypothetical protein